MTMASIRHVGIVVPSVEKYASFLKDLNFSVVSDVVESGEFICHLVKIPQVEIRVIKLTDIDGAMLEILEYLSHPQIKGNDLRMPNGLGLSHLALSVEDIEDAISVLEMHHGACLNEPRVNVDGTVKAAYCRDMYMNLLELVEPIV